jgi:tetratricopeptide (TPR) repeat protein
METDRNLLFGVLALQAGAVTAEQFIEGCTLWANRKNVPLADLLVTRGWLTAGHRADVERLVRWRLDRRDGEEAAPPAAEEAAERPAARPAAVAEAALSTRTKPPEGRGRYTLTRLHALGATGQVWVARDVNLGREVALKELRPEHAEDHELADRLLEEARARGRLDHPSMVPVYEVTGRSGRQSPFYTMRLATGRTLSEACRDYHQRRAARRAGRVELCELLGTLEAVCHAVDYAHSRGVLHGDLKGGNVILGEHGEVTVLGWRLAPLATDKDEPVSAVAGEPAANENDEPPGEAVNTAVTGRADRQTDVRGLGALLYEILTGRPPFGEAEGPAAPGKARRGRLAAPHTVVRDVPPALEAVCLTALATEAGRCYASVADLTRDLQRFLADEPPAVHREPVAARAGRWLRRHPSAAASGVAVLLALAVCLAVMTALLAMAWNRERAALALSEEIQHKLMWQRNTAQERYRMARAAVDRYHNALAESPELRSPGLRALRDSLLASAAAFYERFVPGEHDDPQLLAEQGRGYRRLGDLYADTGRVERAEQAYRRALITQSGLTQVNTALPLYRRDLAQTYYRLGQLYQRTGRLNEAREAYVGARSYQRALVQQYPLDPSYQYDLAETYRALGIADPSQREASWKEGLELARKLAGAQPGAPDYQRLLASLANDLGALYLAIPRPAQADGPLKEALAVQKKLVDTHPQWADDQDLLATISSNLAACYRATGRPDDAERLLGEATALCDKLARDHSLVPEYQEHAATAHAELGALYQATSRAAQAEASYREAVSLLKRLVPAYPDRPQDQEQLLEACGRLCELCASTGRAPEAQATWKQTLALQAQVAATHPQPGLEILARMYARLARLDDHEGGLAKQEAARKEAVEAIRRLAGDHPRPYALEQLARAYVALGEFYRDTRRPDRAREAYSAALLYCDRAFEQQHGKPPDPRLSALRGGILAEVGWWDRACADLAVALEREPDDPNSYGRLAAAYLAAGKLQDYRRICSQALQRFANTTDPTFARPVLRACTAAPDAVPDAAALAALARTALPRTKQDTGLRAAALFRAGNLAEVVRLLDQSDKGLPRRADDWLFLAMAQARRGHAADARRSLAEAGRWSQDNPVPWDERVRTEALRREAAAVVKDAETGSGM